MPSQKAIDIIQYEMPGVEIAEDLPVSDSFDVFIPRVRQLSISEQRRRLNAKLASAPQQSGADSEVTADDSGMELVRVRVKGNSDAVGPGEYRTVVVNEEEGHVVGAQG